MGAYYQGLVILGALLKTWLDFCGNMRFHKPFKVQFATKEKKNKFAKTASPTAPDVSLYLHLLSSFKLL